MLATCPENQDHKEFITVAHVSQDWKVDENGNFLSEISTNEITHGPNPQNTWNCATCGAEATVIE